MGVYEEYRKLYELHIVDNAKLHIVKYDSQINNYEYKPYSHFLDKDALDNISKLVINNFVFYAFSEDEIVSQHEMFGILDDLTAAARYAYESRLPKRLNANKDGTVGEVLLDILIQVFEPTSQKLIARAKYKQQGDNNEIKGYDALYFTTTDDEISLWLGQVKTGAQKYCKTSIVDDLNNKYLLKYFGESVFYIADKADKGHVLNEVLTDINRICFDSIKNHWDDEEKVNKLISYLKDHNIKVKIPCLLAYTENKYSDCSELDEMVDTCVKIMVDEFDKSEFEISQELDYELHFCIFPISDVSKIRENIIDFKKGR